MHFKASRIIFVLLLCFIISGSVITVSSNANTFWEFKDIWYFLGVGSLLFTIPIFNIPIHLNNIDRLVICFFGYSIINTFLKTEYFNYSIYKCILSISLFFLFLSIKSLCRFNFLDNKSLQFCFFTLLFFQVTIGAAQAVGFISSNNRYFPITGAFINPGPYAIFLSGLLIFVSICFIHGQHKNYQIIAFLLVASLGLWIVIKCLSRSAWIGLTGSILFWIFFLLKNKRKRFFEKKRIKFLFATFFLILLLCAAYWLFNFKKQSAIGRIMTWQIAINISRDHLLTGVGQGNYATSHLQYQAAFFNTKNNYRPAIFRMLAGDVRYAFNVYLQLLCEEGIVGILLFAFLIYETLSQALRRLEIQSKKLDIIAPSAISLGVFLISSFFSYALSLLEFKVLFWSLIGIISNSYPMPVSYNKRNDLRKYKPFLSISIFTLGCCLITYGCLRWRAFDRLAKIDKVSQVKKTGEIISDSPFFLLTLAKGYEMEGDLKKAVETFSVLHKITPDKNFYYLSGNLCEKINLNRSAEQEYLTINNAMPNLLFPKYLLANFYYRTKQYQKFERVVADALTMPIKVQTGNTIQWKREIKNLWVQFRNLKANNPHTYQCNPFQL